MYVTPKMLQTYIDFLQFDEEIIVYDCETTGLTAKKTSSSPECHIIQLSAKKLKHEYWIGFHEIEEREWYIKPVEPIPEKITELTGITDEFLADKPSEEEVFQEIKEFFGTSYVAGYNNISFDDKFMSEMYKRYGETFNPFMSIDIYKLAQIMISPNEVPNHKLATIASYFGMDNIMFHNASGDVEATRMIMEQFEKQLIQREIETGSMIPEYKAGETVKVTSVSRYEKGNYKRIYVNTTDRNITFFMDVKNKQWSCKDKKSCDRYNMPDMISQALAIAKCRSEEELAEYH